MRIESQHRRTAAARTPHRYVVSLVSALSLAAAFALSLKNPRIEIRPLACAITSAEAAKASPEERCLLNTSASTRSLPQTTWKGKS
jgi:hypothetical protein